MLRSVPSSTTVAISSPTTLTVGPKPSGTALSSPVAVPVTASSPTGACTGALAALVTLNGNAVISTVSSTGSGAWQVTFTPASAGLYSIAATYTPDGSSVCPVGMQTTA